MAGISLKEIITVLGHAFAIWALCGAIMGIGLAVTSERNALIAHAIGAPIIAAAVSLFYFKRFNYTSPLETAVIFLSFAVFMDIFVISGLILGSFEMFSSIPGTWIPLALIFFSTFLTGMYVKKQT
ncbi:hypothetical protein FTO70_06800 [Methanosarcina sp. KYL-1]|uniref:hypothetical protein n=1 Tax=Methanosarcina sp. KYL-1 TaxID=2602068 RepID=UPI002100F116|nr:hypothetical protein [Methanosarcina sp. KYL-1]MCQ1535400.1 hypothetical protein [Methanosarcina sp. KYL-1]